MYGTVLLVVNVRVLACSPAPVVMYELVGTMGRYHETQVSVQYASLIKIGLIKRTTDIHSLTDTPISLLIFTMH